MRLNSNGIRENEGKMKPNTYLVMFLGAGLCFIVYNEIILLPYQTAPDLGSFYDMSKRNINVNVGLILISYIILCVGSYSYVAYEDELKVMDRKRSLMDLSNMRDTTKREQVVKIFL